MPKRKYPTPKDSEPADPLAPPPPFKRKPGRPKGTKNRPKLVVPAALTDLIQTEEELTAEELGQRQQNFHVGTVMAELISRRMESLQLYEPLPKQLAFHQSRCQHRILRGSNRAGKTLGTGAECARALTGQDPYKKYPLTGGRIFAVGKNLPHCGDVMYRKLFRAQPFFMIRDLGTGLWRVFRPNDPQDAIRAQERKPAPPLVPRRFVKSISWYKKKASQPQLITMTNGWEISFFSSEGKPPAGSDVDLVWLDEEIIDPEWLPEMQARILDRAGKIIWGATPQAATQQLYELHERAEAEAVEPAHLRTVEEYVLLLSDNSFMGDEEKSKFQKNALHQGEEVYRVRIGGEFAIDSLKVYPEWGENGSRYRVPEFTIPPAWTCYAFIDPGRQRCAVLFLAVPPPEEDKHVYVYDELYIQDCDARKFARGFAEKVKGHRIQAAWIDMHEGRKKETGSGVSVSDQYRRALRAEGVKFVETGSEFYTAPDDAKGGREAVHGWLNQDEHGVTKLKVLRRCEYLNWEMKRHRHKTIRTNAGQIPTDEVVKKDDHLVDALRYAAAVDPPWRRQKDSRKILSEVMRFLSAKRARRDKGRSRTVNLGPGS